VRGLVNQSEGAIVLGGVELPTQVELSGASGLFITTEPNDDPTPEPSTSLLLGGVLHRDGAVLPTNRLREIAPEVRAACAACGVAYHSDTWARALAQVGRRLWQLSFPDADRVTDA